MIRAPTLYPAKASLGTHTNIKRGVLWRREQKHEDNGEEHCEDSVCGPLVLLTSVQRKVTNLL